mmetsp:Transcript_233/g.492  ORF Transcript_233/g.492 Transcript_233/m.492 type:complete len:161 (-) Transcript_233:27-509(-)
MVKDGRQKGAPMSPFDGRQFEAFVEAHCGSGKELSGAAVLLRHTTRDTVRLSEQLLAQKALPVKAGEAQVIIQGVKQGDLHQDTFSLAGTEYLVTSVKEKSFYARATGLGAGAGTGTRFPGGVIVAYTPLVVLLGTYVGEDGGGRGGATLLVEDFLDSMT